MKKIIKTIKYVVAEYAELKAQRAEKRKSTIHTEAIKTVDRIYNVKEVNGRMWLTFNGQYCVPLSEMKPGYPTDILMAVRDEYMNTIIYTK